MNTHSKEVMDMIDAACDIGLSGDSSLGWISRCVSKGIKVGFYAMCFIRNFSSVVPIKVADLESSSKTIAETSRFSQFARAQTASLFNWFTLATQEVNNLVLSQEDEFLIHLTDTVMSVVGKKISQRILETIAPGQKPHREIFSLYGSVASQSKSDLLRIVEFIRYSAQLSSYSFESSDSDILTDELRKIAVELKSKWRYDSVRVLRSNTPRITAIAEQIDIEIFIKQFSVYLGDKITQFQTTKACIYLRDGEELLETINNILTSVWSDNIRFVVQSRISRSLMMDLKRETTQIYSSINQHFYSKYFRMSKCIQISKAKQHLSSRLIDLYIDQNKSQAPQMWTVIKASIASEYLKANINIYDVDKETILRISFPKEKRETRELIYNSPSRAYPDGHYDVFKDGKVVTVAHDKAVTYANHDLFHTVLEFDPTPFIKCLTSYYKPGHKMMQFTSDHYVCQLKRGRALSRPDSTTTPGGYMANFSNTSCCIYQASMSQYASQLVERLSKCKPESRSKHEVATSPVSRDACKLFLSSGVSPVAEMFRQRIVERINDDDIITALKLCCICHQIPLCRDTTRSNLQISDSQTLDDTLNRMLKIDSYDQEISKFLSICDEWYRVLEPQGLMDIEQRELLMEWISTRQYANTEDPVVAFAIGECLTAKKEKKRELRTCIYVR